LNALLKSSRIAAIGGIALPAVAAGIVISILGWLGGITNSTLLVAPLGASAALIWMVPTSPLAQPRAVIGGSLVAAFIGLIVLGFFGASPFAAGLSVALALIAMKGAKVFHPPAAALPILIVSTEPEALSFLTALAISTFLIVAAGALFNHLSKKELYPIKWL
jgi:CBS-domain-containing membrane protein